MDETDKRIEEIERDFLIRNAGELIAQLKKCREDIYKLRRYLWLNHGCPIHLLYGDDGEMQCSTGSHKSLDFKRQPIIDLLQSIGNSFDQLKECRGKSLPTFCPHCDKPLGNLMLSAIETIEQRTKDACFEAGWEAILKCGEENAFFNPNIVLEDFKQAIYSVSVEVKP